MRVLTVEAAGKLLRQGELTSVELIEAVFWRAREVDPWLGSFLVRFEESAMEAAEVADRQLRSGRALGPLHGIPIGVKDLLAGRESATTAQSRVLPEDWERGRDSPVVSRLRRAGAVIVGKTTTMEFGTGMCDPGSGFPVSRNPWDLTRWAGGSSSGSASGVAAGLMLAAIGTDTGGSIRAPAAYCGISGLKPTFGRVPKSRVVPLAWSLDHVGPMARSARDCALVLAAIAGHDPSDTSSSQRPVDAYADRLDPDLRGVRVGVTDYGQAGSGSTGIDVALAAALSCLEARGATVVPVELPLTDELRFVTILVSRAEAFAYHAAALRERWVDYASQTRLSIVRGVFANAGDYVQAQRVRKRGVELLAQMFRDVDVVVGPTTRKVAPRLADLTFGALSTAALTSSVTGYWNAVGHPALAVPIGFSPEGLPLSMQIAGRLFEEATVLRVADAYQVDTAWHLAMPPVALPVAADGPTPGPASVEPPVTVDHVEPSVAAAIEAAGLPASDDELRCLVASYGPFRRQLGRLYEIDGLDEPAPVLGIGADY